MYIFVVSHTLFTLGIVTIYHKNLMHVGSKFIPCQNGKWSHFCSFNLTFIRNPHWPKVMWGICFSQNLLYLPTDQWVLENGLVLNIQSYHREDLNHNQSNNNNDNIHELDYHFILVSFSRWVCILIVYRLLLYLWLHTEKYIHNGAYNIKRQIYLIIRASFQW